MSIYLNWAATSYQKPAAMTKAVVDYLQNNHYENQNRALAGVEATSIALKTRETLQAFFNVPDASQVLFTENATMSLNMILSGLLGPKDHVLTTTMEHNAVIRPLERLRQTGTTVTYLPCDETGHLDPTTIEAAILPETKVLVMSHASNVVGTIQPIKACFEIAHKHQLITVLDASQTAGYLPIDMAELGIDVLAFTGHKSLLGLAGIGGFCLANGLAAKIKPWLVGGTGNASELPHQPEFLPDKFEPGTPNTLGILSLGASVKAIQQLGLAKIRQQEQVLTAHFIAGLQQLPVTIYGPQDASKIAPVVSINGFDVDPGELSWALHEKDQIITRCGLHCAPKAHETIGTFPNGTVRFSLGYTTTKAELDETLTVLETILKEGV